MSKMHRSHSIDLERAWVRLNTCIFTCEGQLNMLISKTGTLVVAYLKVYRKNQSIVLKQTHLPNSNVFQPGLANLSGLNKQNILGDLSMNYINLITPERQFNLLIYQTGIVVVTQQKSYRKKLGHYSEVDTSAQI